MTTMWDVLPVPGLENETIVAVRMASGWKMFAWPCHPDEIETVLAWEGMTGKEWRLVHHHRVPAEVRGVFTGEFALKAGWQRDRTTGAWYPIDQPVPRLPGIPRKADVRLTLDGIGRTIRWTLTAGHERIHAVIDIREDSLADWVRFARLLADGYEPHAALCWTGPTHFFIQRENDPSLCRLHVRHYQGRSSRVIDAIVARDDLSRTFAGFLAAIADHPLFLHAYLCQGLLPEQPFDQAMATAQAEWAQAGTAWRTAAATVSDGGAAEAEAEFIARRIAASVEIPPILIPWCDQYQTMLRTLVIPIDWTEE